MPAAWLLPGIPPLPRLFRGAAQPPQAVAPEAEEVLGLGVGHAEATVILGAGIRPLGVVPQVGAVLAGVQVGGGCHTGKGVVALQNDVAAPRHDLRSRQRAWLVRRMPWG